MGQANLRDFRDYNDVQIVAVCDVDAQRAQDALGLVDRSSSSRPKDSSARCAVYRDFRDLLARNDIDAVVISVPDHWHGLMAREAVRAGKDIFLEKPLTFTIQEGRLLSDAVSRYGRVLAVNTWQRSEGRFHQACEWVRNGLIGDLRTVRVGLPIDEVTSPMPTMPVPAGLDYDLWLGPAPWAPYTEKRIHPQKDYGRPGWMRVSDYCGGMITNWGAHHLDIVHWGMGTEHTGPLEIEAQAEFPKDGLWDVHLGFRVTYRYPNAVTVICADEAHETQGVRFEGTQGWVFVSRTELRASPASVLTARLGAGAVRLPRNSDHKRDFLDCIKTRSRPIADAEVGHRSCSACILGGIAMHLGRPLRWDAGTERFIGDDQANRLLSRPMRSPWTF
jgi:predicted dehydrogenase